MIELKTYAGSNVTPQNDAIMNDTNTLNNGIYYGCNVTIKDATTLHINAGQGIVYGRLFEVLDSDIPVSLSPSGTLLGQLYVHIDLSNIAAPIQILVDTGETLAELEDDPQLNIDSGITDMQLATFTVSTVGMSDLVETFAEVEPIRAVLGDADISAIGDGSVKGAIRTINTHLTETDVEIDVGSISASLNKYADNSYKRGNRVIIDCSIYTTSNDFASVYIGKVPNFAIPSENKALPAVLRNQTSNTTFPVYVTIDHTNGYITIPAIGSNFKSGVVVGSYTI